MIRNVMTKFGMVLGVILLTACGGNKEPGKACDRCSVIANPIALNYRFQQGDTTRIYMSDQPCRREAADPVLEYFNGKYYLFASKSGGYWSSPDLRGWTYIKCRSIATIDDYAPAIVVWNDSLYYMASGGTPRIFRTANPDADAWVEIETKFSYPNTDPAFFCDEDGSMYIYWGCSNIDPIVGVQVDPRDGFRAMGQPDTLILHNYEKYGWEMPDRGKRKNQAGFNEGPAMVKHGGKYYLQYAAPATELRMYGDGVYVSDKPLGPFEYMENSPFSYKSGGFIGGAGHGHTFRDKYGNYWHVATMTVSVRHMFERRLGLFPVWFTADGGMYAHTLFADYPFSVPDRKVDFGQDDRWTGWNLLSFGKAVSSSSALPGYGSELANDEQVETWWSAATGDAGEWWQVDLGKEMDVEALQVNFADMYFTNTSEHSYVVYRYEVEASADGEHWGRIVDRTQNEADLPHELIVLPKALRTRYLRITNAVPLEGMFSVSDFRVFGDGLGEKSAVVTDLSVVRDSADRRRIALQWVSCDGATGYIIRWGVSPECMNNAIMVNGNRYCSHIFNRDSKYCFSIDAFNENGVTKGMTVIEVE